MCASSAQALPSFRAKPARTHAASLRSVRGCELQLHKAAADRGDKETEAVLRRRGVVRRVVLEVPQRSYGHNKVSQLHAHQGVGAVSSGEERGGYESTPVQRQRLRHAACDIRERGKSAPVALSIVAGGLQLLRQYLY